MARYAALPPHVRDALSGIQSSQAGDFAYYPCRVILKDGQIFDTVYIEPERPYFEIWGVYPEHDRYKHWIRIEDLAKVENSPTRLPAQFATKIYDDGESGMGYHIFTVVFSDGQRQVCGTGGAVDFIQYPLGKGPSDVAEVIPHEGRQALHKVSAPEWYWCLYSDES